MSNTTRIRKAVFPVAGFGTRFLPATKAQPKEMLPVVDKPLIQYAVEEAYAAGIRDMIFVTGRNKRAIEDHYDTAYELESQLEASGKTALLNIARSVMPDDMTVSYVRQPRMLGLGHAVLCAEHLVGNEPFAVLLADDLMVGPTDGQPVLAQMTAAFAQLGRSLLAVQEVPLDQVKRYGIVAGDQIEDGLVKVNRMVEKPSPESAPSRLGVAGRYVLTPGAIFFDDDAWVRRTWGSRDAQGRPAYRTVPIGTALRVTNTAGDAPRHAILADHHAGLVYNTLWTQSLIEHLRAGFGLPLTPITDADVTHFIEATLATASTTPKP